MPVQTLQYIFVEQAQKLCQICLVDKLQHDIRVFPILVLDLARLDELD